MADLPDGNGGLFREFRKYLVDAAARHERAIEALQSEVAQIRRDAYEDKQSAAKELAETKALLTKELADAKEGFTDELNAVKQRVNWAYAFAAGAGAVVGLLLRIFLPK